MYRERVGSLSIACIRRQGRCVTWYKTRDISPTLYTTGAQQWHIVQLLGDVTSPTTAVPYGSMISELRVLSTESSGRCANSTRCTQTRVHSARGKYIVRHWTSREASLRHNDGWGNWSVSLQYCDLRTRALYYTEITNDKPGSKTSNLKNSEIPRKAIYYLEKGDPNSSTQVDRRAPREMGSLWREKQERNLVRKG